MKSIFIIPEERTIIESRYIPIGIAQLIAIALKYSDVKLIDLRIKNQKLEKVLRSYSPNYVFMSPSYFSIKNCLKIAKLCKLLNFTVIFGGQYAKLNKERLLNTNNVDAITLSEADITLVEILKKNDYQVRGVAYKKNNKIIGTEPAIIKNLDKLPFPAYDFFNIKKYKPLPKNYKNLPVLPVITARGCPWGKCTFCYHDVPYRRHSSHYIVKLISKYRHKIKEILFWDDSFLHDEEWVKEFCTLISPLKIEWSCNARVSNINERILSMIKGAGCWQVLYGIESGSKEMLKKINKGITKKQALNAITLTKKYGIKTRASFIIGLPEESKKDTLKTIKFAKKLDADLTQFSYATPYPGTQMYKNYKTKIISNDYCETKPILIPKGYNSRREVKKMYNLAYIKTYFTPKSIFRNLSEITSFITLKKKIEGLKQFFTLVLKK